MAGLAVGRFFFFFNDTATTEIYTLSLHDALPISARAWTPSWSTTAIPWPWRPSRPRSWPALRARSEEHTSELQSQSNLVCRLLLEKKKKTKNSELSVDTNDDRRDTHPSNERQAYN